MRGVTLIVLITKVDAQYDKLKTPVYHTERPPTLTTLTTVDVQLRLLLQSLRQKFQREVPSFLEIC